MTKKFIDLIPSDLHYAISKFYLAISDNYPLIKMNFKTIKDGHELIKKEVKEKFGDLSSLSGFYGGSKVGLIMKNYIRTKMQKFLLIVYLIDSVKLKKC